MSHPTGIESSGPKMGSEKLVKLSEAAASHLHGLLKKKEYSEGALKVSVVGGGCSGLQYQMELVPGRVLRIFLWRAEGSGFRSIQKVRFSLVDQKWISVRTCLRVDFA